MTNVYGDLMKYKILIALIVVSFIVFLSNITTKSNVYSGAMRAYSSDWHIATDYGVQSCEFSPEKSIITEIEINKQGNHFTIHCSKGPRYDYTNYYYFRFSNCSESDAKIIDNAVRKENNCMFPLSNPIPNNLNHYIAIIAQCLPENKVVGEIKCLPGHPKASVFYAVYDPETGKIYY